MEVLMIDDFSSDDTDVVEDVWSHASASHFGQSPSNNFAYSNDTLTPYNYSIMDSGPPAGTAIAGCFQIHPLALLFGMSQPQEFGHPVVSWSTSGFSSDMDTQYKHPDGAMQFSVTVVEASSWPQPAPQSSLVPDSFPTGPPTLVQFSTQKGEYASYFVSQRPSPETQVCPDTVPGNSAVQQEPTHPQQVPGKKSSPYSKEEWDNHKETIYRLYIVEKRPWKSPKAPQESVEYILRNQHHFPLTYVTLLSCENSSCAND
jgi:hypothetical protein